MALRLTAACKTDAGQQREQNEDVCYTQVVSDGAGDHSGGLFIVADGMGGYHAGEVAAQIAVETISAALLPLLAPASSQPTVHPDNNEAPEAQATEGRRSCRRRAGHQRHPACAQ